MNIAKLILDCKGKKCHEVTRLHRRNKQLLGSPVARFPSELWWTGDAQGRLSVGVKRSSFST